MLENISYLRYSINNQETQITNYLLNNLWLNTYGFTELLKDLNSDNELFRANSLRVLSRILDVLFEIPCNDV